MWQGLGGLGGWGRGQVEAWGELSREGSLPLPASWRRLDWGEEPFSGPSGELLRPWGVSELPGLIRDGFRGRGRGACGCEGTSGAPVVPPPGVTPGASLQRLGGRQPPPPSALPLPPTCAVRQAGAGVLGPGCASVWFTWCILKRPCTQLCLTQSHSEGARVAHCGVILGIIRNYYIVRLRGDAPLPGGPQAGVGGARGTVGCGAQSEEDAVMGEDASARPPRLQMAPGPIRRRDPQRPAGLCWAAEQLGEAGLMGGYPGRADTHGRCWGVRRTPQDLPAHLLGAPGRSWGHQASRTRAHVRQAVRDPGTGRFLPASTHSPRLWLLPRQDGTGAAMSSILRSLWKGTAPHRHDTPPRSVSSPVPRPVRGVHGTPP